MNYTCVNLQCQVVLQGKSRSLIIRELQRTVSNQLADPITYSMSGFKSLFVKEQCSYALDLKY